MIWFTSDQHYGHYNIIKYCNRPFSSVDEMNEAMIENWNKVVQPDDIVYCLGDVSMSFHFIEKHSTRLVGKKYLVPGNHDYCHSFNSKSKKPENKEKWIKEYEKHGWVVLPEQSTLELSSSNTANLCHMPYQGSTDPTDAYEDKYKKWRPTNDGKWLICGHIHEKWKIKDKMINVGVDQWGFTPVSLEEILKIIDGYKQ